MVNVLLPMARQAARNRPLLLRGASMAAVVCGLAAGSAHAQSVVRPPNMRQVMAGITAPTMSPAATGIARPPSMRDALARAQSYSARAEQIRSFVTSARDAALAATRANPTDGLSENGLDPIAAVREAAALTAAGGSANLTRANELLISVSANNDATGKATWQGAAAPVQTTENGRTVVSITQTESRALLSWNRFDIGANTTLNFDQKQGGVAQPGWTAVNRVVDSVAPSTILGNIKADGTVLVLNSRGVIFGQNSQVNLHSLLVSTLDLGNYGQAFRDVQLPGGGTTSAFQSLGLKERNTAYLQNGLFTLTSADPGALPPMLLSPLYGAGEQRTDNTPALEGTVTVDAGASITAGSGGFIILAGPKVESSGILSATDGQVSLQGGRFIAAVQSTGDANSADPDVRGIVLRSAQPGRSNAAQPLATTADDGIVINRGLIDSRRGYISLGAGLYGEVTNAGLLSATTSVARNGKVALNAGRVTITGAAAEAQAGGIVILPDDNGETIPRGTADAPPSFKTSKIEIGARADAEGAADDALGDFIPGVVTLGQNALILAPSADVVIGRAGDIAFDPRRTLSNANSIDIQQGAVIDVSGVKDLERDMADNSLLITPVKRNELRDTPTYREVSRDGDFTLNGQTLSVDIRRSGVRDDGVAWIGSPLIEAGSLASQIGVTAAELMTRGGNVSLGVNLVTGAANPAAVPSIKIAREAVIDFSGGWVRYNEGIVRTSKLITDDGRIVDIGNADPNEIYVDVADGFTERQPRFGVSNNFRNGLFEAGIPEAGYDEGKDAGSLVIGTSALSIEGSLRGNAFNGARQIAAGRADALARGGSVRIGSFTGATGVALGGDIIVHRGDRADADTGFAPMLLSDAMLSAAGLSALTLQTSGAVSFTGDSELTLAPGGLLTVDAGRSIRFDGDIRVPSGTIAARTYELSGAPIAPGQFSAIGSPFRTDDDIFGLYAPGSTLPRPFDISVTGRLSTAGLWTNSLLAQDDRGGRAWLDGGSISLAVAPKVLVAIGESLGTAEKAGDLSGSIAIASGALLDVSAGGYVAADGKLALTGRGGDVSLINETTYASLVRTATATSENPDGDSDKPIAGSNQSVDFTPAEDGSIVPALVPDERLASVTFAEGTIRAFGFAGGGTFKLVSPDIAFNAEGGASTTEIPLDFLATTGFGTLDLTSFRSRIRRDLFGNARAGNSAFFDTTSFVIRDGQTLDLTQTLLPSLVNPTQAASLLALATGSDIFSVLAPAVPQAAWDRRAASLTLGGLTELVVEQGGSIVGAAEAVLTVPKLLNAGTIDLPGGSIVQRAVLPAVLANNALGVRRLQSVFGPAGPSGQFAEKAPNAAGITDPGQPGVLLTNRELLSRQGAERFIYFVGALDAGEGIRLEEGSVTDLSGTALFDPRAPFLANGVQLRQGRLVKGGTISTAAAFTPSDTDDTRTLFTDPVYGNVRYLDIVQSSDPPLKGLVAGRAFNALPGSTIDISGASAVFDELASAIGYAPVSHWSNGGTLSILAGGSIGGSDIRASGGAAPAVGGTLEWLRPTLRQSDAGVAANGVIFAEEIAASGFDTLIARGGITFDGQVSLTLDKGFALLSAPQSTSDPLALDATISVSATEGTNALISAPYIRFGSRRGSIASQSFTEVDGDLDDDADITVTFDAGRAGIDIFGAVLFDSSVTETRLLSDGDLRLIGVDDRPANSSEQPVLNGELIAQGDLTIDAARVYATTGTGNLQRIIEDRRAGRTSTVSPYLIAATGDSTIRFGGSNINAATPLSAGSYLKVQAANIVQDGYLAAPMGLLEIGSNEDIGFSISRRFVPATESVSFGAGSVTTVSGDGVNVPYGTTTDLTEYFFSPSVSLPLTAPPVGELRIGGGTIDVAEGANVDVHGGGNVFAFEFVSGTGGSRDVLDRFNRDRFSSNGFDADDGFGYQFADRRQVFAIVPRAVAATIADFDPIYSADYGAAGPVDLYGAQAGLSVMLEGAPGIPAGEYLLLPAHYALLPGAMRVVENVGAPAPLPGTAQTLLDGSIIVGGSYATAGTGFRESERRQFTVQSRESFLGYSRIETTDAPKALEKLADTKGVAAPRSPLDAARVILSPLTALRVANAFDTRAAAGGRGAQFDIGGTDIILAGDDAADVEGAVTLRNGTLANLNANSLVIGAERTDNVDGTTTLNVLASSITVAGDAAVEAPELVLAVGGGRQFENLGITPKIEIEDGAVLRASGTLADARDGDYIVPASGASTRFDRTGIGAVLRLAQGPERLVAREGSNADANTIRMAELKIGVATLSADNLALDSSRNFNIDAEAMLDADNISLSGDVVRFGNAFIKAEIEAKLAAADRLTLRSPEAVGFSSGVHNFNDLTIDAPAIALVALGVNATRQSDVTINVDEFRMYNSGKDFGGCVGVAIRACGSADNLLKINANEIAFGSGQVRTYGFDGSVALAAARGIYVEGEGGLNVGGAALSLTTPFIADRAIAADPREQTVQPDFAFATTEAISLAAPPLSSGAALPLPTGERAPGTRIAFGSIDAPAKSVSIDGASILATAGIIDIRSDGDVTLAGAAKLATPGYAKTFGDASDSTTVSAGAGAINIVSLTGNIVLPSTSTLVVDSNVGRAGSIGLFASRGAIDFAVALNPGVVGPRDASFAFDAEKSAFDLADFVTRHGASFQGDISIRSGVGDLALGAGQVMRADSVTLTADGGAITVAGTIDTSGENVAGLDAVKAAAAAVNGGDVALYGDLGVTLASTARIDTHTTGYADTDARTATAGDVTIGIGDPTADISIAEGARIDVGARRTETAVAAGRSGNRLVPQTVKDPATLSDTTVYRFAAADEGGTITFRAPVIGEGGNLVDLRLPGGGAVSGADSIQVEGFRRYDLDAIAATGLYDGVLRSGNITYLDLATGLQDGYESNFLAGDFVTEDGLPSLVNFIRNFDISAADGSSLDGMRLRPGVEMNSANNIALLSNWNLGAGVVDQVRAQEDGLLVPLGQLNGGGRMDGDPYLAVALGREAELFENYVTMTYRVGGRVDGEAPVVTLRTTRSIQSEYSITDGFFLFRDRTDPYYMSYRLGGGDRQVLPAAAFTCATLNSGNCQDTLDFLSALTSEKETFTLAQAAAINLTTIIAGGDVAANVLAPYSARANSPAALGGLNDLEEEIGDPLGNMELFPLLRNGSDAVKSSSFRLVGGASEAVSANPLHIDRATRADVQIMGERSYAVAGTKGSFSQYVSSGGIDPLTGRPTGDYALQLRVTPSFDTSETEHLFGPAGRGLIELAAANSSSSNLGGEGSEEIYTVLTWGAGQSDRAAFVREKAAEFFDYIDPASYDFSGYENLETGQRDALRLGVAQGVPKAPSGVAARLSDILAFLELIGPEFAENVVNGSFPAGVPNPPAPISFGAARNAYYGSVVRTGAGSIDIASADDVKLIRTDNVVYRNERNLIGTSIDAGRQVGGTAVYTAGHIATREDLFATSIDGKTTVRFAWGDRPVTPDINEAGYLPSPKGQFFHAPALITGGGGIGIEAAGDIIGRRDAWAETYFSSPAEYNRLSLGRGLGNATPQIKNSFEDLNTIDRNRIGSNDQIWRTGGIGQDSLIAVIPQLFTSGVGALAGDDVAIRAGGDVRDLTVALDTSVVTANASGSGEGPARISGIDNVPDAPEAPVQLSFNRGDLTLAAGGDLIGGQFDIASGAGDITVGGDVYQAGLTDKPAQGLGDVNELRLRVTDAAITLSARGSVELAGISALGAYSEGQFTEQLNSAGNFSAIAGLDLIANGRVSITGSRKEQARTFDLGGAQKPIYVLPGSLGLASLTDDIVLPNSVPYLLYPSATGQLSLLAGGDIAQISLAMSDSDPSLLPGAFTAFTGAAGQGLAFGFPGVLPTTSDATLRLYHNQRTTHAGDPEPARIYADGSISSAVISLPKQARIGAGLDLVDVYFVGQNVAASDVTRITAGRDIVATTRTAQVSGRDLPYLVSNSFTLGGPGSLYVEAGRNLGPFINSAVVDGVSLGGGIRTVGNDFNPWLAPEGADIFALFGVANGVDYEALRETYLNPANGAMLDGDLFEQNVDVNGNASPDRNRPVYAPILAEWLRDNEPAMFAALFGQSFPDNDAGNAALAQAAYGRYADLYDAFAGLDPLRQQQFLIKQLYFNELAQPSQPDSPSFQQYIRGYRAIQTLFPVERGYTDNLATYTTDPATINADHPLGVPTRNLVDGEPQRADRVVTGNVDLRLATIGTTRGGDVTILGPGGDFIAGSVVRTSEQAARRVTRLGFANQDSLELGYIGSTIAAEIDDIPLGFEGILTLRGGAIRSFTDGDFRLNQSRLFTQAGGDITMWSSNGDLNAGQGPKSASNFPPVTIRFDQNGLAEVNSSGSVAGAGIGAFKRTPNDPSSNVVLIAPVGEVDAGDAGVRASGNVFVAAARVANAESIEAGGDISGVPALAVAAAPVVPASAASAVTAQVARLANANADSDGRSMITVDVLGYTGEGESADPNGDETESR